MIITLQEFKRRRSTLLEKMVPESAALFFAAPERQRNADCEYPYRQDSDFWYLTGFNEPEALLLLIKKGNKSFTVLFNRVRDPNMEIWFGRRLGQEQAGMKLGVDRALPYPELEQLLPGLLNGLNVVYHAQGHYDFADKILFDVLDSLRKGGRQNLTAPSTVTDWRPWLHEMRLLKSAEEVAVMKRAGEISALAHTRAMQICRPGMFEYQLEGEILHEFIRHGARSPSYNTIVGGGANGCILHYTENESALQDGELVLIDAGCEYQSYAGDITRTFPVNGKFTKEQRAIYDIVLASQYKAIEMLRPGNSIGEANQAVIHIMVDGLVKLGVMKGNVDQLIEKKAYRAFYMHGLSHWLGLDVHDVGDYGSSERDRKLEPGMVLTVEPGLYLAPDADIPAEYQGIGIRIEDNILITKDGNDVLTSSVVKHPDDIEALMAQVRENA